MDIFKHKLNDATPAEVEMMKEYFRGYGYKGAGYTYLANYIWKDSYDIYWERIQDYLVMGGAYGFGDEDKVPGKTGSDDVQENRENDAQEKRQVSIVMPLTKSGTYDEKILGDVIAEMKRRADTAGADFFIRQIPVHMKHILESALPDKLVFKREPDYDEYVYEKEKLMYLSGRALHKKKNHLNFFYRTYNYEARPIDKDMLPRILELSADIKEDRNYGEEELTTLKYEMDAIKRIMEHIDDDDVYSIAILIKGKLEAFAIGERLCEDTCVEHFEKANDSVRGLYQAVCSEFCKALPEEVVYVNREEDMGIPNLRQAKEALRPHHMEERYTATC